MTIGKIRTILYRSARFLGDVNAVRTGHVGRRIVNRVLGRIAGRILGRLRPR
jgi:hypothetical protein